MRVWLCHLLDSTEKNLENYKYNRRYDDLWDIKIGSRDKIKDNSHIIIKTENEKTRNFIYSI